MFAAHVVEEAISEHLKKMKRFTKTNSRFSFLFCSIYIMKINFHRIRSAYCTDAIDKQFGPSAALSKIGRSFERGRHHSCISVKAFWS
jgi:hypothetical protein